MSERYKCKNCGNLTYDKYEGWLCSIDSAELTEVMRNEKQVRSECPAATWNS